MRCSAAVVAAPEPRPRVAILLPTEGPLLVSTDLHGNLADFERLRSVFLALVHDDPRARWAILGDTVHGPSPEARARTPRLYDFPDRSWEIVRAIRDLQDTLADRVHYVLGNHDYAHVGGPRTAKFYDDEAAALEVRLDEAQVADLRALFSAAHLALVAPCGALLTHGAAGAGLTSWDALCGVRVPPTSDADRELIKSVLSAYGQRPGVFERVAAVVERDTGVAVAMNVHGHDRDEGAFCVEAGVRAMPCLFGAPDGNKRYLVLDLAARYAGPQALREGHEIRRLYPELAPAEPIDYFV